MSKALLPDLSKKIAELFPELEGRAVAVTDAEITKENIPTLPLCMLALINEQNTNESSRGNAAVEITENILVEFWLKPARYKSASGAETPFWSFYDYDTFRDHLLTGLRTYRSPKNGSVTYVSLELEVTALAVVLTFRFRHKFTWCPLDNQNDHCEAPAVLVAKLCQPVEPCIDAEPPINEEDLTCR